MFTDLPVLSIRNKKSDYPPSITVIQNNTILHCPSLKVKCPVTYTSAMLCPAFCRGVAQGLVPIASMLAVLA